MSFCLHTAISARASNRFETTPPGSVFRVRRGWAPSQGRRRFSARRVAQFATRRICVTAARLLTGAVHLSALLFAEAPKELERSCKLHVFASHLQTPHRRLRFSKRLPSRYLPRMAMGHSAEKTHWGARMPEWRTEAEQSVPAEAAPTAEAPAQWKLLLRRRPPPNQPRSRLQQIKQRPTPVEANRTVR